MDENAPSLPERSERRSRGRSRAAHSRKEGEEGHGRQTNNSAGKKPRIGGRRRESPDTEVANKIQTETEAELVTKRPTRFRPKTSSSLSRHRTAGKARGMMVEEHMSRTSEDRETTTQIASQPEEVSRRR